MITLYGRPFSVYVRTVRLALEEKGLPYTLEGVDPFAEGGLPDWYLEIHPFGKVPSLADGDLLLFESDAILRYLEARYPEPSLTPTAAEDLGRMTQAMRVMDSYVYPAMVWSLFVPERSGEAGWLPRDIALDRSRTILGLIEAWLVPGPFLVGDRLTLADTHMFSGIDLFRRTEAGRQLLEAHPRTMAWIDEMDRRDSVRKTDAASATSSVIS